jgi:protease PrsW
MNILHTDVFTVILLALAPGLFWSWIFWMQVRGKGLSIKIHVYLFFAGMTVLPLAAVVEYALPFNRSVTMTIVAPLVEETCKLVVMYALGSRMLKQPSPVKGTGYAVATALGFATAENIYLVLSAYIVPQVMLGQSDPVFAFGLVWKVYVLRALFTVPSHALWSSFWGYALGRELTFNRVVFMAWFASVALHGLFNLMILNFPPGAIVMLLVFMVLWIIFYVLVQ